MMPSAYKKPTSQILRSVNGRKNWVVTYISMQAVGEEKVK